MHKNALEYVTKIMVLFLKSKHVSINLFVQVAKADMWIVQDFIFVAYVIFLLYNKISNG